MRYLFVFLSIAVVWLGVILIASIVPSARGISLFLTAQVLTLLLFFIGFYKK